ncbi:MAG: alpha/beta fold hydrolase, partial [Pseudonocardiaceae bacterium]
DNERITVFAREVSDPDGTDRPFLVFLQGGPGQESPRPVRTPTNPGWLDRALRDYRVLLLDQRGTGRSTPVGALPDMSPQQQAQYLTHFRADSIVQDAEWIRAELGVERWSVLGQSFGGFCALTYLSCAPHGLREVLFTGGVPPIGRHPDEVYRATYATPRCWGATTTTTGATQPTATGCWPCTSAWSPASCGYRAGTCSPPAVSARSAPCWARATAPKGCYLLERDPFSPAFLHDVAAAMPFSGRNPLYAVIHEASYADGHSTRWSAHRVRPNAFDEDITLFTGEHVFPWMFTDYSELAPLREAAELLAQREWPRLFDAERLRNCEVSCAAAIYAQDAYVDRAFSEETARLIPTMRPWLTNEYEHNGLGVDGSRILDRLIALARNRA